MKKFLVILSVTLIIALTVVHVSAASVITGELADYLTLTDPQYSDIRFPLEFADFNGFIVCDAALVFPGETGVAFIGSSTAIRIEHEEFVVQRGAKYSIYEPATESWGELLSPLPCDGLVCYIPFQDNVVLGADSWVVSPGGYTYDRVAPLIRTNVSTGVADVVADFGSFIPRALRALVGIFYADGAFTLLGVLALVSFAVTFAFLVLYFVARFLVFRG